ncbi:hypothetical protein QUF84_00610 [Fictibacillus enclensis]|uniref:hypothetical protein n=1 Tax=Fictibacillus enclensis TaxID=1017270 RepID=UPI0025A22E54|nr:hypothetical protein [Fictibacillus enclensis]MDM5335798.1 hypothetical protein [Fictibacillus enclensis]
MQALDQSYAGWTEYDVKQKCWQVLTLNGEIYVKTDFRGNFMNPSSKKTVRLADIFPQIRNCTDSEGFLLAKRKKFGSPLFEQKSKKKLRMPS